MILSADSTRVAGGKRVSLAFDRPQHPRFQAARGRRWRRPSRGFAAEAQYGVSRTIDRAPRRPVATRRVARDDIHRRLPGTIGPQPALARRRTVAWPASHDMIQRPTSGPQVLTEAAQARRCARAGLPPGNAARRHQKDPGRPVPEPVLRLGVPTGIVPVVFTPLVVMSRWPSLGSRSSPCALARHAEATIREPGRRVTLPATWGRHRSFAPRALHPSYQGRPDRRHATKVRFANVRGRQETWEFRRSAARANTCAVTRGD